MDTVFNARISVNRLFREYNKIKMSKKNPNKPLSIVLMKTVTLPGKRLSEVLTSAIGGAQ